MPDPIPAPAPAPAETNPASLNRQFTAELANAETVVEAAGQKKYAAALDEVEFDRSLIARAKELAAKIRADLARLKKARSEATKLTVDETKARELLVATLQPIQTAARRRFSGDEEKLRQSYFIGETLGRFALADLLAAAEAVLGLLVPAQGESEPAHVLPGVKPEGRIRELGEAIGKVRGKDSTGKGTRLDAGALLESITVDVAALAEVRRQIQLAADQAFPWRSSKVGTIRRAFLLPKDRPMTD